MHSHTCIGNIHILTDETLNTEQSHLTPKLQTKDVEAGGDLLVKTEKPHYKNLGYTKLYVNI